MPNIDMVIWIVGLAHDVGPAVALVAEFPALGLVHPFSKRPLSDVDIRSTVPCLFRGLAGAEAATWRGVIDHFVSRLHLVKAVDSNTCN